MDHEGQRKGQSADAKGKGKGPESSEPELQSSTSESVAARVASSAARLANDVIKTQATAGVLGDALPSAKAGPSGSSSHGVSAPDPSLYGANPAAMATREAPSPFRSQATEHTAQQEAAFSSFLDNIEPLDPGFPQQLQVSHGQAVPEAAISSQTEQAAMEDGAEVVRLLDTGYDDSLTAAETDPQLTDKERIALQQALFQHSEPRSSALQPDWENMLDFVPDFMSLDPHETTSYTGTQDPEVARSTWVGQWQNVLSNYTDAVWGDLGPLVAEARNELQAMDRAPDVEGQPHSTPKALRRLQQILVQIRGS